MSNRYRVNHATAGVIFRKNSTPLRMWNCIALIAIEMHNGIDEQNSIHRDNRYSGFSVDDYSIWKLLCLVIVESVPENFVGGGSRRQRIISRVPGSKQEEHGISHDDHRHSYTTSCPSIN